MTVIAFDGKTIASDSRTTGNYIDDNSKKIFKKGGRLYGVAGRYTSALMFLQWTDKRNTKKEEWDFEDDFEVLEIEGGECFYYDKNLVKTPQNIPCSIGSGCHLAMAAMMCGKNAVEAVKIAKKLDESCGGRVQYQRVKR